VNLKYSPTFNFRVQLHGEVVVTVTVTIFETVFITVQVGKLTYFLTSADQPEDHSDNYIATAAGMMLKNSGMHWQPELGTCKNYSPFNEISQLRQIEEENTGGELLGQCSRDQKDHPSRSSVPMDIMSTTPLPKQLHSYLTCDSQVKIVSKRSENSTY
jgi:hypothetical protein